jgi:cellulose synthase/poly-beta-1,6-N-acetylglucosamine synthase-like glycosyltransferase
MLVTTQLLVASQLRVASHLRVATRLRAAVSGATAPPSGGPTNPPGVPLLTPATQGPTTVVPNRGGITTPHLANPVFFEHWTSGEWIGYVALVLITAALAVVSISTLRWMLHAWRTPGHIERTGFSDSPRPPRYTFSILVPGRHEEEVMGQTLEKLLRQDHPGFEIIAVVGDDDPETEAVAREVAKRNPDIIRVVVDDSVPKNKPSALNRGLADATGDIIGVFDAEDDVHTHLLTLVDSRFTETAADVVQGGVQLMNFRDSWWSLRNVLEYYFWFRSRLHLHADSRFIPLRGNTVFIRRTWLDWSEGWDADCLAEDCELGVRLSSAGAKVVVAYSPDVVTREETPPTLTSLFKQRTRWNQGFLQVVRKGEWRKLPSLRQRIFARYVLAMPFLQASTALVIPLSLVFIFVVKVPTIVALITFIPLATTIVTVAGEVVGLAEFGRLFSQKVRMRDYARLVVGTFPYQVILAAASARSIARYVRGDRSWEKTRHTNAHRDRTLSDLVPAEASR